MAPNSSPRLALVHATLIGRANTMVSVSPGIYSVAFKARNESRDQSSTRPRGYWTAAVSGLKASRVCEIFLSINLTLEQEAGIECTRGWDPASKRWTRSRTWPRRPSRTRTRRGRATKKKPEVVRQRRRRKRRRSTRIRT